MESKGKWIQWKFCFESLEIANQSKLVKMLWFIIYFIFHWAIFWSLNDPKMGLRCDILSFWLHLTTAAFPNLNTLDFTFSVFTWMNDIQKHPHHYQTSCTSFFRMAERWNAWHAVWSVAKCILYFKQTLPWKLWYVCPWKETVHVFHLHRERKRNGGC